LIRRRITVAQAITQASSTRQGDIWNGFYDQRLTKGLRPYGFQLTTRAVYARKKGVSRGEFAAFLDIAFQLHFAL
jgi:hypothetical protein